MKINIVDVQNMLSNQDYLEFDKLLDIEFQNEL